jgi:hypothetical protein
LISVNCTASERRVARDSAIGQDKVFSINGSIRVTSRVSREGAGNRCDKLRCAYCATITTTCICALITRERAVGHGEITTTTYIDRASIATSGISGEG